MSESDDLSETPSTAAPENLGRWQRIVKNFTAAMIKGEIKGSHTLGTELMARCINQDQSIFDENDLQHIDPEYLEALKAMVISPEVAEGREFRAALERLIQEPAPYSFVINLEPHYRQKMWRTEEDGEVADKFALRENASDFSRIDKERDLARALGSVTVSVDSKGSVTVNDYFDVDRTFIENVPDKPSSLLFEAGMASVLGENTARNSALLRMFCQEGEDEQPTDTSIPIRINLGPLESLAPEPEVEPPAPTPGGKPTEPHKR